MECPYCEEELHCNYYYYTGNLAAYEKGDSNSGFQKLGDIYKCDNEECEMYQESFYTDSQDELYEGYPC